MRAADRNHVGRGGRKSCSAGIAAIAGTDHHRDGRIELAGLAVGHRVAGAVGAHERYGAHLGAAVAVGDGDDAGLVAGGDLRRGKIEVARGVGLHQHDVAPRAKRRDHLDVERLLLGPAGVADRVAAGDARLVELGEAHAVAGQRGRAQRRQMVDVAVLREIGRRPAIAIGIYHRDRRCGGGCHCSRGRCGHLRGAVIGRPQVARVKGHDLGAGCSERVDPDEGAQQRHAAGVGHLLDVAARHAGFRSVVAHTLVEGAEGELQAVRHLRLRTGDTGGEEGNGNQDRAQKLGRHGHPLAAGRRIVQPHSRSKAPKICHRNLLPANESCRPWP